MTNRFLSENIEKFAAFLPAAARKLITEADIASRAGKLKKHIGIMDDAFDKARIFNLADASPYYVSDLERSLGKGKAWDKIDSAMPSYNAFTRHSSGWADEANKMYNQYGELPYSDMIDTRIAGIGPGSIPELINSRKLQMRRALSNVSAPGARAGDAMSLDPYRTMSDGRDVLQNAMPNARADLPEFY